MSSNWTELLDEEDEDFEKKVEEAENIIDDLELEEPFWIKPYTDFDGPVRTREIGQNEFHDGVIEAFEDLREDEKILNPGIISGRGLGYLLGQTERMGVRDIDIAAEMGAMYFTQEDLENETPDPLDSFQLVSDEEQDKQDIYEFNRVLFENLAEEDLQLMYGDNLSNVVGSACIEAYGINLPENRFSVEDTVYPDFYDNPSSQKIRDDIKEMYNANFSDQDSSVFDRFNFHGDLIRFDKDIESIKVLTDALALNPFVPWGFQDEGNCMTVYPRYRADPDFSYDDFEQFVSSVVEDYNSGSEHEFWSSTYHDYAFDFGKKGYENLKSRAVARIIDETGIDESVVAANTGDKPTDMLDGMQDHPYSISFAQEGTEAEEYCVENDVSHVAVENAAESFAILSELASRNPPEL